MNHPQDVPASKAKEEDMSDIPAVIREEPSEEEFRERLLGAISLEDGESTTEQTEKVLNICASMLKIKYEEIQPFIQAGFNIGLDQWMDIHERLEEGAPVEVREARRAAQAIDTVLSMSPSCNWQTARKVNRAHLLLLLDAEDGLIEEGPLKDECLEGLEFMIYEPETEKDIHRLYLLDRTGLLPQEDYETQESLDSEIARRSSLEILDDLRIEPTPPGKREPLSKKEHTR